MKFFVPACGDRITMSSSWTFPLHLERRNIQFAISRGVLGPEHSKAYGIWDGEKFRSKFKVEKITLEKGTIIECDRIYVRTFNKSRIGQNEDYDSITWKVIVKGKAAKSQRFWVKLPDCYNIEYELQPDSLYRNRVKVVREVMES